jgi:hypothetical protein
MGDLAMAEGKKAVSDLRWLVLFAVLMVLPWILILGWLGFVPTVSNLLVSRAPQNLGVKYAVTDLKSFEAKSGITVTPQTPSVPAAQPGGAPAIPVAPPVVAAPPKPLDLTVSQEELSAVINQLGANLLPLRMVQVKLGQGSAEISGALDTSQLEAFLQNLGVRPKDIEGVGRWVKALGDNIPIHLKANGGVADAQLNAKIESLEVGGFHVPSEQLQKITKGGIHADLSSRGAYSVQTLTLQEGNLKFIGSLPPNFGAHGRQQ